MKSEKTHLHPDLVLFEGKCSANVGMKATYAISNKLIQSLTFSLYISLIEDDEQRTTPQHFQEPNG